MLSTVSTSINGLISLQFHSRYPIPVEAPTIVFLSVHTSNCQTLLSLCCPVIGAQPVPVKEFLIDDVSHVYNESMAALGSVQCFHDFPAEGDTALLTKSRPT